MTLPNVGAHIKYTSISCNQVWSVCAYLYAPIAGRSASIFPMHCWVIAVTVPSPLSTHDETTVCHWGNAARICPNMPSTGAIGITGLPAGLNVQSSDMYAVCPCLGVH